MKKFLVLIMSLVMTLSFAACGGGVDKQPAFDAFNEAKDTFNEAGAIINENPENFTDEEIKVMQDMAEVLNQHAELLNGDTEIEQEQLDEMIAWYGTVDEWATQVLEQIK
ncbi:MAG: hypothetical protein RR048_01585 [Oscillospiraceae bacterium]